MNLKTEAEAREFWKGLDERTRLMLAKTAPRVAPPWSEGSMRTLTQGATRFDYTSGRVFDILAESVRQITIEPGEYRAAIKGETLGYFTDLEAAKSACDAKLRELGFVLEGE